MSEFFVGQQVVCVDDAPSRFGKKCPARRGNVYTVSAVFDHSDGLGLRVCEIKLPRDYPGFHAHRFRPVEYKAMEVFRKIARKVTEGRKVEFVE
jgi:hypothetical protein